MAQREVQVQVDAFVDGETVSGVITSVGPSRRFSGRLGLITALDQALEADDHPADDDEGDCS